jgi:hypothetical protein
MESSDDSRIVRRAVSVLFDQHSDELIQAIAPFFMSHMWNNGYILYPKRIHKICCEEVERFGEYLQSLDIAVDLEREVSSRSIYRL